jgi:hypothetical protein
MSGGFNRWIDCITSFSVNLSIERVVIFYDPGLGEGRNQLRAPVCLFAPRDRSLFH